jgi:GntR family transcriptional regulator/MocR family aminotransferase
MRNYQSTSWMAAMDFPILLDPAGPLPLHRQLYRELRQAILAGRLAPGQRLPSTRALARQLEVSRSTAALGYEQLVSEGYLEAARGSGTFVPHTLPAAPPAAPRRPAPAPGPRLSRFGRRVAAEGGEDAPVPPSFYDFSPGCPSLEDFPRAPWSRLLARHARRAEPELLDYGPDPRGHGPLREAIADYLRRSRAVRCAADQVLVLSGTQQALDLALRLLVEPGETVAMEDPGYPGARRAILAHGARILPLPAGDAGLDLAPLERPGACRLAYLTPSHQFPTGSVLDLPGRLRLLAWARERGTALLEDDYDSEFRYRGRPLPAMQGLDPEAPVLYAGTFSKVLAPALHLAYLVVPPALAEVAARARRLTSREPSALEQAALADFIREGHLERHVRRMRGVYARRREALVESLLRHFGAGVTILGDAGGMHLMVRFRDGRDDAARVRRAAAAGVVLPAMARYHLGPAPPGGFILGFAGLSPARIREGVRRLAAGG